MPWCQTASFLWIPSPIIPISTLHCCPALRDSQFKALYPPPSKSATNQQGEGQQAMRTLVPPEASSQLINEPFIMQ